MRSGIVRLVASLLNPSFWSIDQQETCEMMGVVSSYRFQRGLSRRTAGSKGSKGKKNRNPKKFGKGFNSLLGYFHPKP